MSLLDLDSLLDQLAEDCKKGEVDVGAVFESFRRFERSAGLACPSCGHQDLDAGIWDDGGIPEALCGDVFHSVNRHGQDLV